MKIQRKDQVEKWNKGIRGEKQLPLDKFPDKDKPKKKYTQDWRAYNLSQTQEFTMFQDILIELIDKTILVIKPTWKKGRPFANFKDMIFCCVMRVYFEKSSRRSTSFLSLAKGMNYIQKIPHFNTLLSYYKRSELTSALKHLIEQSGLPLKEIEHDFAVDSSGFSTTLYGRWFNARMGDYRKRRLFKKAHVTSGVKSNIISAVDISEGYHHDSPYFEELVRTTAKNFNIREVSGDGAYSSKKNLQIVSELGAIPFIMFRKNTCGRSRGSLIWKRMYTFFKEHQEEFLDHYHKRSNAESVFNMIKRKMGTHLNCRTDTAQINELLCKCLAHNILVLIAEVFEANTFLDFEDCKKVNVRIAS